MEKHCFKCGYNFPEDMLPEADHPTKSWAIVCPHCTSPNMVEEEGLRRPTDRELRQICKEVNKRMLQEPLGAADFLRKHEN